MGNVNCVACASNSAEAGEPAAPHKRKNLGHWVSKKVLRRRQKKGAAAPSPLHVPVQEDRSGLGEDELLEIGEEETRELQSYARQAELTSRRGTPTQSPVSTPRLTVSRLGPQDVARSGPQPLTVACRGPRDVVAWSGPRDVMANVRTTVHTIVASTMIMTTAIVTAIFKTPTMTMAKSEQVTLVTAPNREPRLSRTRGNYSRYGSGTSLQVTPTSALATTGQQSGHVVSTTVGSASTASTTTALSGYVLPPSLMTSRFQVQTSSGPGVPARDPSATMRDLPLSNLPALPVSTMPNLTWEPSHMRSNSCLPEIPSCLLLETHPIAPSPAPPHPSQEAQVCTRPAGSSTSTKMSACTRLGGSADSSETPDCTRLRGSADTSETPASTRVGGSADSSEAPGGTRLGGSASSTETPARTRLGGSADSSEAPGGTRLGGSASSTETPARTRLGGSADDSETPACTRLGGSADTSETPARTRLGGSADISETPARTRLGGSADSTETQARTRLGGSADTSETPARTRLGGSADISETPARTRLGGSADTSETPACTRLGGSADISETPARTRLGGSADSTETPARTRLGGSADTSETSARTRLGGSADTFETPARTRLGGSADTSETPGGTRLGGSADSTETPARTGLGGSADTSETPARTRLGGSADTSETPARTRLGGSADSTETPARTRLGGSTDTSKTPARTRLGGSTDSTETSARTRLGGSADTSETPARTRLGGSADTSETPARTRLGGSADSTETPARTRLGGSADTSETPARTRLGGSADTSETPARTRLGGSADSTETPARTRLGGSANSTETPAGTRLGGSADSTETPACTRLGGSADTSEAPAGTRLGGANFTETPACTRLGGSVNPTETQACTRLTWSSSSSLSATRRSSSTRSLVGQPQLGIEDTPSTLLGVLDPGSSNQTPQDTRQYTTSEQSFVPATSTAAVIPTRQFDLKVSDSPVIASYCGMDKASMMTSSTQESPVCAPSVVQTTNTVATLSALQSTPGASEYPVLTTCGRDTASAIFQVTRQPPACASSTMAPPWQLAPGTSATPVITSCVMDKAILHTTWQSPAHPSSTAASNTAAATVSTRQFASPKSPVIACSSSSALSSTIAPSTRQSPAITTSVPGCIQTTATMKTAASTTRIPGVKPALIPDILSSLPSAETRPAVAVSPGTTMPSQTPVKKESTLAIRPSAETRTAVAASPVTTLPSQTPVKKESTLAIRPSAETRTAVAASPGTTMPSQTPVKKESTLAIRPSAETRTAVAASPGTTLPSQTPVKKESTLAIRPSAETRTAVAASPVTTLPSQTPVKKESTLAIRPSAETRTAVAASPVTTLPSQTPVKKEPILAIRPSAETRTAVAASPVTTLPSQTPVKKESTLAIRPSAETRTAVAASPVTTLPSQTPVKKEPTLAIRPSAETRTAVAASPGTTMPSQTPVKKESTLAMRTVKTAVPTTLSTALSLAATQMSRSTCDSNVSPTGPTRRKQVGGTNRQQDPFSSDSVPATSFSVTKPSPVLSPDAPVDIPPSLQMRSTSRDKFKSSSSDLVPLLQATLSLTRGQNGVPASLPSAERLCRLNQGGPPESTQATLDQVGHRQTPSTKFHPSRQTSGVPWSSTPASTLLPSPPTPAAATGPNKGFYQTIDPPGQSAEHAAQKNETIQLIKKDIQQPLVVPGTSARSLTEAKRDVVDKLISIDGHIPAPPTTCKTSQGRRQEAVDRDRRTRRSNIDRRSENLSDDEAPAGSFAATQSVSSDLGNQQRTSRASRREETVSRTAKERERSPLRREMPHPTDEAPARSYAATQSVSSDLGNQQRTSRASRREETVSRTAKERERSPLRREMPHPTDEAPARSYAATQSVSSDLGNQQRTSRASRREETVSRTAKERERSPLRREMPHPTDEAPARSYAATQSVSSDLGNQQRTSRASRREETVSRTAKERERSPLRREMPHPTDEEPAGSFARTQSVSSHLGNQQRTSRASQREDTVLRATKERERSPLRREMTHSMEIRTPSISTVESRGSNFGRQATVPRAATRSDLTQLPNQRSPNSSFDPLDRRRQSSSVRTEPTSLQNTTSWSDFLDRRRQSSSVTNEQISQQTTTSSFDRKRQSSLVKIEPTSQQTTTSSFDPLDRRRQSSLVKIEPTSQQTTTSSVDSLDRRRQSLSIQRLSQNDKEMDDPLVSDKTLDEPGGSSTRIQHWVNAHSRDREEVSASRTSFPAPISQKQPMKDKRHPEKSVDESRNASAMASPSPKASLYKQTQGVATIDTKPLAKQDDESEIEIRRYPRQSGVSSDTRVAKNDENREKQTHGSSRTADTQTDNRTHESYVAVPGTSGIAVKRDSTIGIVVENQRNVVIRTKAERYGEFKKPEQRPSPKKAKVSEFQAPRMVRRGLTGPLDPKIPAKHINKIPIVAQKDVKGQPCWMQKEARGPQAQMPWSTKTPAFACALSGLPKRLLQRTGSIEQIQKEWIVPQIKQIETIKLENGKFPGKRLPPGVREKYSFENPAASTSNASEDISEHARAEKTDRNADDDGDTDEEIDDMEDLAKTD